MQRKTKLERTTVRFFLQKYLSIFRLLSLFCEPKFALNLQNGTFSQNHVSGFSQQKSRF